MAHMDTDDYFTTDHYTGMHEVLAHLRDMCITQMGTDLYATIDTDAHVSDRGIDIVAAYGMSPENTPTDLLCMAELAGRVIARIALVADLPNA